MKRTCLQKHTHTDEHPDAHRDCEFLPVEISNEEQHLDPKEIEQVKSFVRMKRKYLSGIVFLLFSALLANGQAGAYYSVKSFGAKGDGKNLDCKAINSTIVAVSEQGGGTVFFPAGDYLSFSIRLKSNIRLYLDQGATIIAASPDDFPGNGYDIPSANIWGDSLKYQDFGHSHWKNSLIWGIGLENITIEGHGLIYGKGLIKWGSSKPGLGNKSIALKDCHNVTLRDFSILQGGHFGILPTGVDNFTLDNLKIDSNRDGINIDCCKNVRITNCQVNTPNDDAIVLKSSYALGYLRATENVVITNCQVSGFDMGSMLDGTFRTTQTMAPDKGGVTGRIKLGTESNGGFKNIAITNCTFTHCRGLAIETVDGALIEDVVISNLTMRDIVNAPFYIRVGSRMRGPEGIPVGLTKRIIISNITVEGVPPRYAALIMGIPGHPVNDISFDNIKMELMGGAADSIAMLVVPELETGYPDPRMYGDIPASGFFVRHASNIEFNNVDIQIRNADPRPIFILEDVRNINFYRLKTDPLAPPVQMKQWQNVAVKEWNRMEDKTFGQSGKLTF